MIGGSFISKIIIGCIVIFAVFSCCKKLTMAQDDPAHLVINEVYANPDIDSLYKTEFIEIYNPNSIELVLNDYTIEDGTHVAKEVIPTNISPFGYLVLEKGKDFSFGLNDTGDEIILKSSQQIIDEVAYGNWPEAGQNCATLPVRGKSISRFPNGNDTDRSIDFVLSPPNPLKNYEKPTYTSSISITEIYPSPDGDQEEEFIEIFNNSESAIDISDWSIDDDENGSTPYTIANQLVEPKSFAFFAQSQTHIYLNNDKDCARLIDPNGEIKSMICYDKSYKRQSLGYFDEEWKWTIQPTPGSQNVYQVENIADSPVAIQEGVGGPVEMLISNVKNLENGASVSVTGIVTVTPGLLSDSYFYLQDESGGIQIYFYYKDFPAIEVGDTFNVTGTVSRISGEVRIKIDNSFALVKISSGGKAITPSELSGNQIGLNTVGNYIITEGEVIKTSGSNFTITCNGKTLDVVIRKSTGIKKPRMKKGDRVIIAGILSVYKGKYRILPYKQEDVMINGRQSLPNAGTNHYYLISIWIIFLIVTTILAKSLPILRKL